LEKGFRSRAFANDGGACAAVDAVMEAAGIPQTVRWAFTKWCGPRRDRQKTFRPDAPRPELLKIGNERPERLFLKFKITSSFHTQPISCAEALSARLARGETFAPAILDRAKNHSCGDLPPWLSQMEESQTARLRPAIISLDLSGGPTIRSWK